MFSGYLTFAGTELANIARTAAYVENFIPAFGLQECYGAENLRCVLGDAAYRSPALDNAPWYSPARPASAKFFGFYPLAVLGAEDSSMSSTITELTGDGAVHSRPRASSKEMRVTGLLIGEDYEGVDEGLSWLKGLLAGSNCAGGNCSGDTFCYLAYDPVCCDYSEFPEAPVDDASYVNDVGGWTIYRNGEVEASPNGVVVTMPCGNDGAQYLLTALIPNQPYRVVMELASPDEISVEVQGGSAIVGKRVDEHFPAPRTPWVLDFIPSAESTTLLITNPGNECDDRTATIYSLLVSRTPRMVTTFLPRFTPDSGFEPVSWTFNDTPAAFTTTAVVNPAGDGVESIRFRYQNDSGSDETLDPTATISRVMRGMTPGLNYTTYVNGFYTTGEVGLSVDTAIISSQALGDDWYAITFTASRPQHVLSLYRTDSVLVPDETSLDLTLYHVRTDFDLNTWDGALPIPDQTEASQRTLYGVTLLGGPFVTQRFTKDVQGAMMGVEFILNATHPFIYGREVPIWKDPSAATYLISQISCANGYPIRTNYFTNPRFADQTAGADPLGGIDTYVALTYDPGDMTLDVADPNAAFTVKSIALTPETATVADTYIEIPTSGLLDGHTYTFSADFALLEVADGTPGAFARQIVVTDAAGVYTSGQLPNSAGGRRLSVTFTYSAPMASIRIYHGHPDGAASMYVTNFLFEESPVMGSFFDGESSGGSWDGDANESISYWAKASASTIVDPDCPPIPLPPQPPSIELACPIDVEQWRRFSVPIPASEAGGWTFSAPLVTLTTSSSEVRDVRVRFYANPFARELEELNPCDYCGEFFISYLPDGTSLSIDSILRTVEANVAGTGVTQAMNLVSNIDGGPIEWPLLTCDIPYVMTVDVSPEEVLDLDVQVSIARRD